MNSSCFELFHVNMQNGSQPSRMAKWLESRLMPLCQKHGYGPMGFFNVAVGPHFPSALMIFSFDSLADMETKRGKLHSDPEFVAAAQESEKDEPAFYSAESMLLGATAFCPPLTATPAGDPPHKVYELRIYQSPTNRQLGYLHDRFAGGEIETFHKNGIHPILFADTIFGPNMPNMAYLIPFESEAHREKAWASFMADPTWVKIRDESIRHGGEIMRNGSNMFLTPMSFSMLR